MSWGFALGRRIEFAGEVGFDCDAGFFNGGFEDDFPPTLVADGEEDDGEEDVVVVDEDEVVVDDVDDADNDLQNCL